MGCSASRRTDVNRQAKWQHYQGPKGSHGGSALQHSLRLLDNQHHRSGTCHHTKPARYLLQVLSEQCLNGVLLSAQPKDCPVCENLCGKHLRGMLLSQSALPPKGLGACIWESCWRLLDCGKPRLPWLRCELSRLTVRAPLTGEAPCTRSDFVETFNGRAQERFWVSGK